MNPFLEGLEFIELLDIERTLSGGSNLNCSIIVITYNNNNKNKKLTLLL